MPRTDTTTADDLELFARARAGDRDAFGELVRRHQRAALRLAAVISGTTEEAADIVQEAFVNVHRNLARYRGEGSVRSWMLRIVANHAKNHVRSRSRRRRRDDLHASRTLVVTPAADDDALDRVELQQVAAALGKLSMNDREVLACRFVSGLSEAETAATLAVAVGTVKSRTARALTRLRRALDDDVQGRPS